METVDTLPVCQAKSKQSGKQSNQESNARILQSMDGEFATSTAERRHCITKDRRQKRAGSVKRWEVGSMDYLAKKPGQSVRGCANLFKSVRGIYET